MKLYARIFVSLCVILLIMFIYGVSHLHHQNSVNAEAHKTHILYYYCPMHPSYRTDKPGIAPCCGMQVEPLYAYPSLVAGSDSTNAAPVNVQIDSERQQLAGVKVSTVDRMVGIFKFRTFGRVAPDETREFRIVPPIDGLIRQVAPFVTGDYVKKNSVLATFLNREILRPQQAYIQALNASEKYGLPSDANPSDSAQSLILAGEDNLEYLGISKLQIRHIALTRKTTPEAEIRAPASGILMLRNAYQGTRFERGTELFRIVDVSKIWVLANLFENDARLIRSATNASVEYQDRIYAAQICKTPPQFDPASRALKIRLELDNPGLLLRPEMFVNVEFSIGLSPAVAIPTDAIIDTGREKIVYVDRGNGFFAQRIVQTGWRLDGHTQILSGLNQGEQIVTSGSFLLDSESRVSWNANTNLTKDFAAIPQRRFPGDR